LRVEPGTLCISPNPDPVKRVKKIVISAPLASSRMCVCRVRGLDPREDAGVGRGVVRAVSAIAAADGVSQITRGGAKFYAQSEFV